MLVHYRKLYIIKCYFLSFTWLNNEVINDSTNIMNRPIFTGLNELLPFDTNINKNNIVNIPLNINTIKSIVMILLLLNFLESLT